LRSHHEGARHGRSIGAVPLHLALSMLGPVPHVAAIIGLSVVGTWASNEVARAEGIEDPQKVVIDEVCGTLIAMAWSARARSEFSCWAGVVSAARHHQAGPIDTVQRLQPPALASWPTICWPAWWLALWPTRVGAAGGALRLSSSRAKTT